MEDALRRYRVPLLVTLLVGVALELVDHRLMVQLLRPQILEPDPQSFRLFNEGLGPFTFFFAGFLALSATTWALTLAVRSEDLFATPWRIVLGLFSCVFLPVSAVGIFVAPTGLRGDPQALLDVYPYLVLSATPTLVLLALAVLRHPGPWLPRLGVAAATIPLVGYVYFGYRTAQVLAGPPSGTTGYAELEAAARVPAALGAAFRYGGLAAFAFFVPLAVEPTAAAGRTLDARARDALRGYQAALFGVGPVALAAFLIMGLGVWIKLDYSHARAALEAMLSADLGTPSAASLAWLGSLFAFFLTVLTLVWRRGPGRTVGVGLLLLWLGGCRLAQPLHDRQVADPLAYLLVIFSLVALANGISAEVAWRREAFLRWCSPIVDPGRLAGFLDALRAAVGREAPMEPELVRTRSDGLEEVILTSTWRTLPVRFHLLLSGGRVRGAQLVLGQALAQAPDWRAHLSAGSQGPRSTETAAGAASPGAASPEGSVPEGSVPEGSVPEGMAVEPGGRAPAMRVRDRAGISTSLLDEELSDRLAAVGPGRLDVWSQVGVKLLVQFDEVGVPSWLPLGELASSDADPPDAAPVLDALGVLAELAGRAGVAPE